MIPVLAIAAPPLLSGATTSGTGPLNILTPSNLSANLNDAFTCKNPVDPFGPGHYTSSLNSTYPDTPPLPQSFLKSIGFNESEESLAFDCFIDFYTFSNGRYVYKSRILEKRTKKKKKKRNCFEAPDTLCVPMPLLKSMLSRSKAKSIQISSWCLKSGSALPFGAGILYSPVATLPIWTEILVHSTPT